MRSTCLRDNPSARAEVLAESTQSRVRYSQNARPVRSVPAEAALDRGIAHLRAPDLLRVGRPRPRVQDQPVVPAQGHQDMSGRVGTDPGQCEQSLLELLVRQL